MALPPSSVSLTHHTLKAYYAHIIHLVFRDGFFHFQLMASLITERCTVVCADEK